VPELLAEWHRPAMTDLGLTKFIALLESGVTAASTPQHPARLLLVLAVAAEDTVYGVFEAVSAEHVLQMCARSGVLPHRLTPHVSTRILGAGAAAP
jgi:hypothetical protein